MILTFPKTNVSSCLLLGGWYVLALPTGHPSNTNFSLPLFKEAVWEGKTQSAT